MKVDAQRIRDERTRRAWSQEHLADVSGLGLRTIQRMENGSNASLESVAALSSVLTIPIEELVAQPPRQRTFTDVLAANRLLVVPALFFIATLVTPPVLKDAYLAFVTLWGALEIYLAIAARRKAGS